MIQRTASFWLSLVICFCVGPQLWGEQREVVIQLGPALHKEFAPQVQTNAKRWFGILGSSQSVKVVPWKEKLPTTSKPTLILKVRLCGTWWRGQNHRQFNLIDKSESSLGGGLNLVTETFRVVDFNKTHAMVLFEYRLLHRRKKNFTIAQGVMPCFECVREGVQLPPRLLQAKAKQLIHQTIANGLAKKLNRRLEEDVARKVVKNAELKTRAGNVVVDTAFINAIPCGVQGKFTFKLGRMGLETPFNLKCGEHKRQEFGVIAAGIKPNKKQLICLNRCVKVTIDRIRFD